MNDFDILLHRTISDGKQFDKLIPATECARIDSGNGNTELSMEWIKEMSLEFHPQLQKVAKVLQKETLQKTCEKIHWFAYNHFQYMADDDDQMLRSPACSWKERHIGIDCKSYSIIASALLLNLELKHYIRKIKQPGFAPTEWTHVYVVVPKDQVKGDLRKGYFTIDGTIPTVTEPAKTENKDLFMDHYKLNGASGLHASNVKFNFSSIGSFISDYKCIGGTAFDEAKVTAQSQKIFQHFEEIITAINAAVASNNMTEVAEEINLFFGSANIFWGGYRLKRHATQSWNQCSARNLDAMIAVSAFYLETVGAALNGWIDKYFNRGGSMGEFAFSNAPYNAQYGLWLETFTWKIHKFPVTIKSGTSVPKFEITPYVAQHIGTNGQLNVSTFLKDLSSIINTFTPISSGGSNSGSFPTANDGYYNQPISNTPKTAGGASIVGWLVLAGAAGYAFTKMKDKPATASKKTQKTPVKK